MARAALLLAAVLAWPGAASAGVKRGDRARDFVSVVDASGKRVSLKSFQDQVVVMTFGASWCVPCKKELPAFEKLAGAYAKRSAKVVFLAVNIDEDKGKGKSFMSKAGIKLVRALYDTQKSTVESYDPPKMPTTFVIRRGVVKYVQAGYNNGDENALRAIIDRELGALK